MTTQRKKNMSISLSTKRVCTPLGFSPFCWLYFGLFESSFGSFFNACLSKDRSEINVTLKLLSIIGLYLFRFVQVFQEFVWSFVHGTIRFNCQYWKKLLQVSLKVTMTTKSKEKYVNIIEHTRKRVGFSGALVDCHPHWEFSMWVLETNGVTDAAKIWAERIPDNTPRLNRRLFGRQLFEK